MKLRLDGNKQNGNGMVQAVISVVDDAGEIQYQDKANLSSQKSRERLQKNINDKFPDIEDVDRLLLSFLNEVSSCKPPKLEDKEEFSEAELAEGERLLERPTLMEDLVTITQTAGHVEEGPNKKALILICASTRDHRRALSAVVKSSSSAGKSALVDAVLNLFPQSWVVRFSRITANALFYLRDRNLSRKILFVDEVAGSEDSGYPLRISISEGEVSVLVTGRNPVTHQLEAQEVRIPADCMVFLSTTTKLALADETETRILDLFLDESEEQTKRILAAQAELVDEERLNFERRIAQAALSQLNSLPVAVPYSRALAVRFPTKKVRARRDFPKLLGLIQACCLLHQRQRRFDDKGRLIATMEDYAIVRDVAETILAGTLKEMTPQEEKVLDAIIEFFRHQDFSVKELRSHIPKVAYDRIKKLVSQLREKGAISWNGEPGWKSRYSFVEDPRTSLILPTVDELAQYAEGASAPDIPDARPVVESHMAQLGDEDASPNNPETVTNGDAPEAPSTTEGESPLEVGRGSRGQGVDGHDIEAALGMSTDAALAIWHREGSPIIHLGVGVNAFDLEKWLRQDEFNAEHVEVVSRWLIKHSI